MLGELPGLVDRDYVGDVMVCDIAQDVGCAAAIRSAQPAVKAQTRVVICGNGRRNKRGGKASRRAVAPRAIGIIGCGKIPGSVIGLGGNWQGGRNETEQRCEG